MNVVLLEGESNQSIRYPKLTLVAVIFVSAFISFTTQSNTGLYNFINNLGPFGSVLAGFLYAYSFTAAPATFILLEMGKEQSLLFVGLSAGIGALIGDLVIFRFVRQGFNDEVQELANENLVIMIRDLIPIARAQKVYFLNSWRHLAGIPITY